MTDQHATEILSWNITEADGRVLLGNTHPARGGAADSPRGVIIIAHGFKGYKDYGMFPRLAEEFAAHGWFAHRFNFSHSGMTNNIATFKRPDLFEQDTWNKGVADVHTVIDAVKRGELRGQGLPIVVLGHSRGGATALLTAGRAARDGDPLPLSGLISLAAPSQPSFLSKEYEVKLLEDGFIISPSSRTGQDLRIGKQWLQEQLDDPEGHDICNLAKHITTPTLIVHGSDDPTVPVACARQITQAIGDTAQLVVIDGAKHVFNTPNPFPVDGEMSDQLAQVVKESKQFLDEVA